MRGLCAFLLLFFVALPAQAQTLEYFSLEMGWLAGQCLVDPEKPACDGLSLQNPQARSLTLIGLKPESRPGTVKMRDCDPIAKAFTAPAITPTEQVTSCSLPALRLDEKLRADLSELMPDIATCPDRAYWAKFGSCSLLSQQHYFTRAVDRARDIQKSLLTIALADSMGKRITRDVLATAFEQQFGEGTARSLQLVCAKSKKNRQQVLTEIRIFINQLGSMRSLNPNGLWYAPGITFKDRCGDDFLVAEPGAEEPPPPEKPLFEDPFASPE